MRLNERNLSTRFEGEKSAMTPALLCDGSGEMGWNGM
jgi:hypothetical protein